MTDQFNSRPPSERLILPDKKVAAAGCHITFLTAGFRPDDVVQLSCREFDPSFITDLFRGSIELDEREQAFSKFLSQSFADGE